MADQNPPALRKEVWINAPASRVWQALTDPEQMKQWYFDVSGFKAEVGHEFSFCGQGQKGEKYLHLCRILELLPLKKLRYTWAYEGFPGASVVSFELFEEEGGTRLVLTHEGLENFPADHSDFARENFNRGWTWLIEKSIREFVEKQAV